MAATAEIAGAVAPVVTVGHVGHTTFGHGEVGAGVAGTMAVGVVVGALPDLPDSDL